MNQDLPFVGLTIVDGTMTAGQVALAVLRKHFVAMLSKEAGTLEGSDPEELHDMRVATRRIRAATSLFRAFIHPDVLACRDEFAWLGRALGSVRDLDVQREHVQTWAKELPGEQEARLVPFEKLLAGRREKARADLGEALRSPRYRNLATQCAELLLHGPLPAVDEGIVVVAPELVDRRMKSFRKAADGLKPTDAVERFHLARIRAKKLRYAMEFVGAVYGKPAKDAAERVVAVQDLLGLHQDCVVAGALIEGAVSGERLGGQTLYALGMLSQYVDGLADKLRREFPERLKDSHGREWRAFREVMRKALPGKAEEDEAEPVATSEPRGAESLQEPQMDTNINGPG